MLLPPLLILYMTEENVKGTISVIGMGERMGNFIKLTGFEIFPLNKG